MAVYRTVNFNPFNNYTVSASNVSADQTVVQPTDASITGATDLLISNSTAAVAFVRWGTTTQTAVTTDFAVLPGAIVCVNTGIAVTHVGVILASGSGSVYLSIGVGS